MPIQISQVALEAIWEGVKRDDPVAELSYAGLSQRIINMLEGHKDRIVFLRQLLGLSVTDLEQISNMGPRQIEQIYSALNNYHLIPQGKKEADMHMRRRAEICRCCVYYVMPTKDCEANKKCPLKSSFA